MIYNFIGFGPQHGKKTAYVVRPAEEYSKPQKYRTNNDPNDEESRMFAVDSAGRLIRTKVHGQIHLLPLKGPVNPKVKEAVASITKAVSVLTRIAAAAGKDS